MIQGKVLVYRSDLQPFLRDEVPQKHLYYLIKKTLFEIKK